MEFKNPLFEDDYVDGETAGAGDVADEFADDVADDILADAINDVAADKEVDPLRVNPDNATGAESMALGHRLPAQRRKVLQTAVDAYYKNVWDEQGLAPGAGRDANNFMLDGAGRLRLKAYPNINIVNARTGRPNAFSTIAGQKGGADAIHEKLGFADWDRNTKKLTDAEAAALKKADQQLGEAAETMDNAELQDMGQAITEAANAVQTMETSFTELGQSGVPPITQREFRGVYRALERFRGEHTNNVAKLSELDRNIAKKENHLPSNEEN
ncbi:hypothetical protein RRG08_062245 [Elysia crispata]|uniref:Uncharacterized protein n=1 Tax=Elysia crispata TaxID=231223 RepID=A0AAE0XVY1_9GAST|nr:hypothetical protein RRG08_062245 [Elysia crispata]